MVTNHDNTEGTYHFSDHTRSNPLPDAADTEPS